MSARAKPYLAVEDYLAHERSSADKHEYYAGQIFALAGASEQHNLIAGSQLTAAVTTARLAPHDRTSRTWTR